VRYEIDQSQAIFSVRYEIYHQSQTIFSVRYEIDQLQLIFNVYKIILLIVTLTDNWHQNIAFWLMFWGNEYAVQVSVSGQLKNKNIYFMIW